LFRINKLDSAARINLPISLTKPKHLFHEIDKNIFFCRGLASLQFGGLLSPLKETLPRHLFRGLTLLLAPLESHRRVTHIAHHERRSKVLNFDSGQFQARFSSGGLVRISCGDAGLESVNSQRNFCGGEGDARVLSPQLLQHSILPDSRVAAQRLRA